MAIRMGTRRSLRVWQRNRDVFFKLWKSEALPVLFEPVILYIVMGAGLGTVVKDIEGGTYREFIGPGLMAGYAMFAAVFESAWGTYVRMSMRRTFDAMIVTPLNIEDVITGEILWATTRSLITACVVLLILAITGTIQSPLAILTIPAAGLVGFFFSAFATVYTSRAPSVSAFNYLFSIIIYPMFFIAGVFFPLDDLPQGIQTFAWFLPLTSGVNIIRNLVDGNLTLSMLWGAMGLVLFGIFFYFLALRFMRQRLIR